MLFHHKLSSYWGTPIGTPHWVFHFCSQTSQPGPPATKRLPLFSKPRTNIQRSCIIRRFLGKRSWSWNGRPGRPGRPQTLHINKNWRNCHTAMTFLSWDRNCHEDPHFEEPSDCVFLSLTVRTNMVSQAAERLWPHSTAATETFWEPTRSRSMYANIQRYPGKQVARRVWK